MSRAGLALRDGEGVEVEAREVVVQRVREPLPPRVLGWMEVGGKELFQHRRCDPRAPAARNRRKNHGDVHVALMVGREKHRSIDPLQVIEAFHTDVREHTRQRQDPGRL